MCIVNTVIELTSEKIKYYQELYVLYRDYIKHEDELINARSGWMINIQSFLIATFGFSYQKRFEIITSFIDKMGAGGISKNFLIPKLDNFKNINELENIIDKLSKTGTIGIDELKIQSFYNLVHRYDVFLGMLALTGTVTSFSALLSIHAAQSSIDELNIKWKNIIRGFEFQTKLPEIIGGGSLKANKDGKFLSQWLPWFFLGAWIFIVVSIWTRVI